MVADYRTRLIGSLAFQCRPFGRHFFSQALDIEPRRLTHSACQYHSTMPTRRLISKAAQRCTRAIPSPAPPRKHPRRFRVRLVHAPTKVHPSPAPSKSIPEAQKQKNALNCNFFAIRDCCELSNHGSRRKSAGNQPISCPFPLCSNKKESAIAKKLHEYRDFCFHSGKIAVTEQILKRNTSKRATTPLARTDNEESPRAATADVGRGRAGLRVAQDVSAASGIRRLTRRQQRKICAS